MKTAIAMLIPVLLLGCATGPKFSETKIERPIPDGSRIYVYRDSFLGWISQPDVLLDGKKIGTALSGGVFCADIEPGRHVLSIRYGDELILPIYAVPNGTQYVRVIPEPKLLGRGNFRPVAVDAEVGQHEIRDLAITQSCEVVTTKH